MALTKVEPYIVSNTGNLSVANIDVSGNATLTGNFAFTGTNISLGNINNIKATGGTSGQVIQTDGAGNLSFTSSSIAGKTMAWSLLFGG